MTMDRLSLDACVTSQQFVILSKDSADSELVPVGSRNDIVERLSSFNTMPEREGEDILYGPGISIQLPPEDPVKQMLMTITEEEIAWKVISRILREMKWKLFDPATGRELNA